MNCRFFKPQQAFDINSMNSSIAYFCCSDSRCSELCPANPDKSYRKSPDQQTPAELEQQISSLTESELLYIEKYWGKSANVPDEMYKRAQAQVILDGLRAQKRL